MSRFDIYIKAASALAAEGAEPTLAAVRARVGRGSYSTIADALCVWRAGLTLAAAGPGEPPERLQAMLNEMWLAAHAEADARLFADRAALASTRSQLEQAREALAHEADTLAARVTTLEGELAAAVGERDAAIAHARQAEAAADELRRALEQRLSGRAKGARVESAPGDDAPF